MSTDTLRGGNITTGLALLVSLSLLVEPSRAGPPTAQRPSPPPAPAHASTGPAAAVADTTSSTWRLSDEPVLSIGAAAGPAARSFGEVADVVRLSSGTVVVAAARAGELRFFDGDGELLHRAGGEGPGPREFTLMASVGRCWGDSVYVFDKQKPYLSVWAPDGTFARTVPLSGVSSERFLPRSFACNDRGTLAFVQSREPEPPPDEGPHRPVVPITLMRPDGELVELGRFPGSERYFLANRDGTGTDRPRPLGKRTSVAVGDSSVYVGTGDAFEIAVFSTEGERTATLRDTVTRAELDEERLEAYADWVADHYEEEREREEMRRFARSLEFPGPAPAHLDLVAGDDGHLWVEQFHLPGEPATWRVYRPGGDRVASVEMPRRFTLMAAGADHVLGVWRDELDVHHVRMYRILRE